MQSGSSHSQSPPTVPLRFVVRMVSWSHQIICSPAKRVFVCLFLLNSASIHSFSFQPRVDDMAISAASPTSEKTVAPVDKQLLQLAAQVGAAISEAEVDIAKIGTDADEIRFDR